MKINIWVKAVLCILLIPILFLGASIGLVITAFAGTGNFYTPVIVTFSAILFIYSFLMIFNFYKPKILTVYLIAFVGIVTLIVTVYEVNRGYHQSIPTVSEKEVNLYQYKPFAEKTKVVSLNRPATLKIESDLPKLDGATALYPLYSAFVQAVYPKKDYNPYYDSEVMCTKTNEAYERLINGEVDIIFCARPSKQQIEAAKNKGLELKLTSIGREAFVFFVNSKNKVTELSTTQIQGIYSGKITNWQDVGGDHQKIKAFQRPENSGSQTMLQKLMAGKTIIAPPKEDVVAGMGGIINQTANYRNYKNAIGYSFLFFATQMIKNNQIRLLKVDGVEPNRETIKSNTYPLTAEFYAVTAGTKNPNVQPFIDWILSPQGQYLVEKTGYTALK